MAMEVCLDSESRLGTSRLKLSDCVHTCVDVWCMFENGATCSFVEKTPEVKQGICWSLLACVIFIEH